MNWGPVGRGKRTKRFLETLARSPNYPCIPEATTSDPRHTRFVNRYTRHHSYALDRRRRLHSSLLQKGKQRNFDDLLRTQFRLGQRDSKTSLAPRGGSFPHRSNWPTGTSTSCLHLLPFHTIFPLHPETYDEGLGHLQRPWLSGPADRMRPAGQRETLPNPRGTRTRSNCAFGSGHRLFEFHRPEWLALTTSPEFARTVQQLTCRGSR